MKEVFATVTVFKQAQQKQWLALLLGCKAARFLWRIRTMRVKDDVEIDVMVYLCSNMIFHHTLLVPCRPPGPR